MKYRERTTGCKNTRCSVHAPRCPVCKFTFVETEGQVCNKCGIGECENCKNKTSLLYKQQPHEHKISVVMGYGAYEDNCKNCGAYTTLGEYKICKQCTINQYSKYVCYDCLHNSCCSCGSKKLPINGITRLCIRCEASHQWGDTISSVDRRTVDECKICKRISPVNEYTICENCYIFGDHLAACVKCSAPMRRTSAGQLLCNECSMGCLSCGTALSTNFKNTRYCDTCDTQISSGICTDCGRYDTALDNHGKCSQCTKDRYAMTSSIEKHMCVNDCGTEVPRERQLCDECKDQLTQCPNCNKNDMSVNNFVCHTCYDNIILEYE